MKGTAFSVKSECLSKRDVFVTVSLCHAWPQFTCSNKSVYVFTCLQDLAYAAAFGLYRILSTIWISLLGRTPVSSFLFTIPTSSVSGIELGLLAAKRKLSTVDSIMDSLSWNENPIETRTRMIVGVIP
ncbi:hypothetical protein BYT27DRAFT_6924795 [Phlegmacium glaucopus]|nr:hypothetical protein BYT27DRAFT_6924795 [Phlegmacium glaucopus]